jgi:hypothetical protein
LPIADCRLPIADCRLPIADCRLPIADCRLPIALSYFLHTSPLVDITPHNILFHSYYGHYASETGQGIKNAAYIQQPL